MKFGVMLHQWMHTICCLGDRGSMTYTFSMMASKIHVTLTRMGTRSKKEEGSVLLTKVEIVKEVKRGVIC